MCAAVIEDNDKVPQTAQSKYLPNLVVLGRACDFGCGSTASCQIYHDVTLSVLLRKCYLLKSQQSYPNTTCSRIQTDCERPTIYSKKLWNITTRVRWEKDEGSAFESLWTSQTEKKCYQSGQDRCLQSPSLLLSPSLLVWTAMIWVTWGNNLMTTARLNAAGLGGLVGLWGTDYHVQCV